MSQSPLHRNCLPVMLLQDKSLSLATQKGKGVSAGAAVGPVPLPACIPSHRRCNISSKAAATAHQRNVISHSITRPPMAWTAFHRRAAEIRSVCYPLMTCMTLLSLLRLIRKRIQSNLEPPARALSIMPGKTPPPNSTYNLNRRSTNSQ